MSKIEIFCERFPKYALFAPHWEPIAAIKPSSIGLDLSKIEVLYLFDLALAYEEFKPWLREDSKRRLVFIESQPGVIASLFYQETDLFGDMQVDIELMPINTTELAERYPAQKIEVLGHKKLRLELLRKTTLSYSRFIDRFHGHYLFSHFVRNVPHVERAFYANGLRNAFQGFPAIVCGAGPSLEKVVELLKQLETKALIIAGGSAVAGLYKRGITPHFGVAIDPNLEEYHRFQNVESMQCPLLFSTRLFPEVFSTCSGPFGYLRCGIGGAPELWLEEELGLTEPLLGQNLSDESISVTSICLAFAQHLGCSTIHLAGVDLAYTDGKRYIGGVLDDQVQFQKIEKEKTAADRILSKKDKRGKPVYTTVRWVMEARAIAHFAKKHPEIHWINATEGGLRIKGFEERALEKLDFPGDWNLKERVEELIKANPMPTSEKNLLGELKNSLERMIGYLEVMAGKKGGSKPLAELEMQEELASSILFYDMEHVIRQSREKDPWGLYLDLASRYLNAFRS